MIETSTATGGTGGNTLHMDERTLKTSIPKYRLLGHFVWGGVAILKVLNLVRNGSVLLTANRLTPNS